MEIQNYVINIADRTLADRLRLRQVLLDNGQVFNNEDSLAWTDRLHTTAFSFVDRNWRFASMKSANISLEDFIQKFKKSDEVRNLAFTTNQPDGFNLEQVESIIKFTGDNEDEPDSVVGQTILSDDGSSINFMSSAGIEPEHLEVSYKDVFPEAVEEPVEPEFEYPIYKINKYGAVQKFIALQEAELIISKEPKNEVGTTSTTLNPHTDSYWQDWDPQFDYDTVMAENTVVHCTTEAEANELLYWAHKQGLKYRTGSSYLDASHFGEMGADIVYDLLGGFCETVKNAKSLNYTILTMDEARNGKQPDSLITPLVETVATGPEQQCKFKAGDIVDTTSSLFGDNSKALEIMQVDNHYSIAVYTIDKSDYWWVREDELTLSKKEQIMNKAKVGDRVIAKEYVGIGDLDVGSIETITKVKRDQIWVSNTNNKPWYLGITWELYTGDAEASNTTASVSEEQTRPLIGSVWNRNMYPEQVTVVEHNGSFTNDVHFNGGRCLSLGQFLRDFTPISAVTATTETSEPTTTKEQTMNTNIEIKVNGEIIETATKVNKPKSDFKLKPSVMALYHTADGQEIELKRFTGKTAAADAQAHLVTMLAEHPNAKMTPYTVGKSTKIKHQFEAAK